MAVIALVAIIGIAVAIGSSGDDDGGDSASPTASQEAKLSSAGDAGSEGDTDASDATPEGFPSQDDVPLVDGERSDGRTGDGSSLHLTVTSEDRAILGESLRLLVKAGYDVVGGDAAPTVGNVISMTNDEYGVRLVFGETDDGQRSVTYTVAPKAGATNG